ncbi:MAG: SH3 domain-containing protein [Armatimonadota bacterium]
MTPDVLNIRSGPGTSYQRITTLPRGTKVYVVEAKDHWCKVSYAGGKRGWAAEWLLEFSPEKGRRLAAHAASGRPASAPAWIAKPSVNVRSGPTTQARRIAQLRQGRGVVVVGKRGKWSRIRLASGATGWIRSDLLTSKAPRTAETASKSAQPRPPKGFVNDEHVNVRSGPGSRFPRTAVLDRGTLVWILDTRESWYKVKYGNGRGGWIAGWLVKRADAPPLPSPAAAGIASSDGEEPDEAIDGLSGWICSDDVKARYGPGMDFDVKSRLERGTRVAVMDIDGHWCKVRLPATETFAWVPGWTLNFAGPNVSVLAQAGDETVDVHVGWIAKDDVNLRGDPGRDSPVITTLTANTQIVILDKRADWYKVALSDNRIGWVWSGLVTTREQRLAAGEPSAPIGPVVEVAMAPASSPPPADLGGRLVRTALSYLGRGIRYRYGGSSVTGGFDCSGFIQFILQKNGRDMPRRASHQFLYGKPVEKSQLLPGDLVFFKNTYKRGISHVGMYIGAGRFIHSSSAAKGITISSLSESFYKRKYAGARRLR